MITLNITALTAEELMNQIKDLHRQCAISGQASILVTANEPAPSKESHSNAPVSAPVEEKKKGRTKPKEELAGSKLIEVDETKVETTPDSPAITKEEIQEITQKVSSVKNLEVARSVIAQFKKVDGSSCVRISDIQVKDYESYIATCNAEIEG